MLLFAFIYLFILHYSGPLPSRELHSTDETNCGETLGDVGLVYHLFTSTGEILPKAVTRASGVSVQQQVTFLTVSPRGPHTPSTVFRHLPPRKDVVNQCLEFARTPPLKGTSLHRRNKMWRDPGGSWTCLPPVYYPFLFTSTGQRL